MIFNLVINNPVNTPAITPEIKANNIPNKGDKDNVVTAETAHPTVKDPSTVKSGIFKTLKLIKSPKESKANMPPNSNAPLIIIKFITFSTYNSLYFLFCIIDSGNFISNASAVFLLT